jgi:hypothetical protein
VALRDVSDYLVAALNGAKNAANQQDNQTGTLP